MTAAISDTAAARRETSGPALEQAPDLFRNRSWLSIDLPGRMPRTSLGRRVRKSHRDEDVGKRAALDREGTATRIG